VGLIGVVEIEDMPDFIGLASNFLQAEQTAERAGCFRAFWFAARTLFRLVALTLSAAYRCKNRLSLTVDIGRRLQSGERTLHVLPLLLEQTPNAMGLPLAYDKLK
jgi:hypothetical protein